MILRRWHVIGIPLLCAILFGLSVPWWLRDGMLSEFASLLLLMWSVASHFVATFIAVFFVDVMMAAPLEPVLTIRRTPRPPPPDPSKPGGEVSEVSR